MATGGTAAAYEWPGLYRSSPVQDAEPITREEVTTAPSLTDRDSRTQHEERASRTNERPARSPEPQAGETYLAAPIATERRFLTEDLNVWTGPGEDTTLLTVLDEGSKIAATGRVVDGWAEIVRHGALRWVNAEYLSEDKPEEDTDESDDSGGSTDSGGLSDELCASGSEVEDGLVYNAIAVHRAVCAEFPEVTTYYGLRPGDDGEHGTGQAIDIMISDSATGDAIAEFVQDNYSALGVSEIIWSQQIWTVERSSEGWRWMDDAGSDTANHYDHVHVTVY